MGLTNLMTQSELYIRLIVKIGAELVSRAVVEELMNEYRACESADYISYVSWSVFYLTCF